MASFELSRAHGVGAFARESRAGRYLPLYLAGLAAGAAAGVVLIFATTGGNAAVAHAPASIEAPVSEPADVVAAPALPVVVAPFTSQPVAAAQVLPDLQSEPLTAFSAPEAPSAPDAAPPVPAAAPAAMPTVATAPDAPVAPTAVPVAEKPAAAPASAPTRPNFYLPAAPGGGATELELRLLTSINSERAAAGLAPYTLEAGLSQIARIRVRQLVDQNYFGHTDPFGYSMYVELLAHFGYSSYAWAGENLALNNYGVEESPERAVVALMKSPTHRANLLAGDFFRIGIGELTTPDGRHFYAMIFLG